MYIEPAYYLPHTKPIFLLGEIKARHLLPQRSPSCLLISHNTKAATAPMINITPDAAALAAAPALEEVFADVDDATVVGGSVVGTVGATVGVADSVTDAAMTEGET